MFGKYKEILQNKEMPNNLKRRVFNQCIIPTMTYGCQTWTLTKDIVNKMVVSQRKMERKMLGIKQIDRIPNSTIRDKTKVDDILKVMASTKWKRAGHVARMNDNRWRELAEGYFQQWKDTVYVQGTKLHILLDSKLGPF